MKKVFVILGLMLCLSTKLMAQQPPDTLSDAALDSILQTLPEVMVTGERPMVKAAPGKLVYDVPRLIADKPIDNIYDALKEIPGVAEMNGGITLGGLGVAVVLDGKAANMSAAQLLALLKSMPANRIENVEVMYNAPARYQVRGALINIMLKHGGETDRTLQGELYGLALHEHNARFEERGALLYAHKRFSADLLYMHTHGKSFYVTRTEALHTLNDGSRHRIGNEQRYSSRSYANRLRLGMVYQIGKDHQLDLVYNGDFSNDSGKAGIGGTVFADDNSESQEKMHNVRFDYRTPFGLKAGAEYTHYEAPRVETLDSRFFDEQLHYRIENSQMIDRWKFFLSEEHKLAAGWNVNYGVIYNTSLDKSFQNYTKTDAASAELPDDLSSRQREDNVNIYAGLGKNFGAKLVLDVSLAAEYYKSVVWKQWDWYPNLNLTFLPADGHTFQLSFSSNKTYPEYWAVKNFVSYTSGGYGEISGNPLLKPSSSYRLQMVYLLRNKYTFAAWLNQTDDYFIQVPYQRPDKLSMRYQYLNFDFQQRMGMQISVPFKFFRWWQATPILIGSYQREKDSDFYDIPFDRDVFWGMAMLRNTFIVSANPDISMTVNGMIRNRTIQGPFDLPSSGNLDVALRYRFAKGKATLNLFCNDIFETRMITPQVRYATQHLTNKFACYREAGISFTYTFGGFKENRHEAVDTSRFKK